MDGLEQKLIGLLTDSGYHTNIRKSGVYRFPSSYRFETHAHEEYEINYINAGACIMEVDGSYVPLKAGECIVIAPGSAHCFMVDMQRTCKITQLELVIRCREDLAAGLAFPGFPEPYHRLRECERLLPLLERICYYCRAGDEEATGTVQIDLMLLQLYALLSESIEEKRSGETSEEADRVRRMIGHIHENLDGNLNIEQMALQYGVSSRYVRKYFKQQMGMGCNEYITMLRLGKAKRLLWNPDISVTDVALMSGFSSSQYFCKVFHRLTGMTPAEYRRRWQDEEDDDDNHGNHDGAMDGGGIT